jgi:hypothetical protein
MWQRARARAVVVVTVESACSQLDSASLAAAASTRCVQPWPFHGCAGGGGA